MATATADIDVKEVSPDLVRRQGARPRFTVVREDGREIAAILGAEELAHYRRLLRREVEVYRAGEFPDDIVAALEAAEGKYGRGAE